MSLETEVKNLTSAVSAITNLIKEIYDEVIEDKPEPEPKPEPMPKSELEPEPKPEPEWPKAEPMDIGEEVSLDDLREALVDFREKQGAPKTKEVLSEMGYKRLSDIPLTDGQNVIDTLGKV